MKKGSQRTAGEVGRVPPLSLYLKTFEVIAIAYNANDVHKFKKLRRMLTAADV